MNFSLPEGSQLSGIFSYGEVLCDVNPPFSTAFLKDRYIVFGLRKAFMMRDDIQAAGAQCVRDLLAATGAINKEYERFMRPYRRFRLGQLLRRPQSRRHNLRQDLAPTPHPGIGPRSHVSERVFRRSPACRTQRVG